MTCDGVCFSNTLCFHHIFLYTIRQMNLNYENYALRDFERHLAIQARYVKPFKQDTFPVDIYLLKVNNKKTLEQGVKYVES